MIINQTSPCSEGTFVRVQFLKHSYSLQQSQRNSGHYTTLFPPQHDANLVLSAIRHQRDMFSGGTSSNLGIPDVHGHVGSVIHAFENLAYRRQLQEKGEKPYESSSSDRKDSVYKIILPPPPPPNVIQPQSRAASAAFRNTTTTTTQTPEALVEDPLSKEEETHRKFPQSYVKTYKVLPPFQSTRPRQPSKIPTKTAASSKFQPVVYLKPTQYSEDDVENDFLRGSTVSQSFIQKKSTYEQNLLHDGLEASAEKKIRPRTFSRDDNQKSDYTTTVPLLDEVAMRYKEYKSKNLQARSTDRAEL